MEMCAAEVLVVQCSVRKLIRTCHVRQMRCRNAILSNARNISCTPNAHSTTHFNQGCGRKVKDIEDIEVPFMETRGQLSKLDVSFCPLTGGFLLVFGFGKGQGGCGRFNGLFVVVVFGYRSVGLSGARFVVVPAARAEATTLVGCLPRGSQRRRRKQSTQRRGGLLQREQALCMSCAQNLSTRPRKEGKVESPLLRSHPPTFGPGRSAGH